MQLEGTEIGRMSPLERKRLEKKIEQLEREKEELEKENAELKDYVRAIFGQGLKFMKEVM